MATIFDQEELKYTQTDIDVRDAKIEELQRKLREMEKQMRYERNHRKLMENSSWGSSVYKAADDWDDIIMRSNRYNN